MIDAKLLRSDTDRVRAALARRGAADEIDAFLELDGRRRTLLASVEQSRADANAAAKEIGAAKKEGRDTTVAIAKQAQLKRQTASEEQELAVVDVALHELMIRIPNIPDDTAADGLEGGRRPDGQHMGRAAAVRVPAEGPPDAGRPRRAGPDRHRGRRPRLRHALPLPAGRPGAAGVRVDAVGHGHAGRPRLHAGDPAVLVREAAMEGTGYFPEAREQVYEVPRDELFLVGTAEVPLASLHGGKVLDAGQLPLRYVGFSTCFRREAGAAGKDTRGIFRVHQFDKLEMFVYTLPEESVAEHDRLLAIEEEIAQALGFHYRVQNIAVGDLGAPAAKKYDIEVWLPGQERYRELTSCSNCTDYQARRLDTRFRAEKGTRHVHMLNGTAITSSRTLLAVIEYGQREDGSVATPEVLRPFGAPAVISPAG